MSKRCELQKEYYQANGNYKGNGKYCNKYVSWLEDQILAFRIHDVIKSVCGKDIKSCPFNDNGNCTNNDYCKDQVQQTVL